MKGVTLIELVVTIVILGILGAVAGVFLVPAFEAYFASQRRADLADTADAALRRMVRDVRLALPNSPRVDASNRYLEFLITRNGGRYRSANDSSGATNEEVLESGSSETAFDTLGVLPATGEQQVQVGDYVVVHNLGIAGANAYDVAAAPSRNIAQITAFGAGTLANENRVSFAATQFPLDSPGRRFYVVSGPVTYACETVGLAGGNGTGTLRRWSGYAIQLRGGLPPTTLPGGAADAVLATNVSACELFYTSLAHLSRGLVGIRLAITRANETVTLFYEVHVSNVP